jgi:hypothetical protein
VLAIAITLGVLFGIIFYSLAKGCAVLGDAQKPGQYKLRHDTTFAKIYVTPATTEQVLVTIGYSSTGKLLNVDVMDKDGTLAISTGVFARGYDNVNVHDCAGNRVGGLDDSRTHAVNETTSSVLLFDYIGSAYATITTLTNSTVETGQNYTIAGAGSRNGTLYGSFFKPGSGGSRTWYLDILEQFKGNDMRMIYIVSTLLMLDA